MRKPLIDHYKVGSIDREKFDRFYIALKHGSIAAVLEFLAGGGDPNLRSREGGWTLLHMAAHFGRRPLLEILLDKGADIEAVTIPGFTPLAMAAHSGRTASVRVLLTDGASLDCRPLGMELIYSLKYAAVKNDNVRKLLSEAITSGQSNPSE